MAKKKKIKKRIVWDINDLDIKNKGKLSAVAVKYDLKKDKAPKILAAGKGKIAEKILKVAAENQVPMCPDPTLTDLLSKLEIQEEIPPELYTLVAEILAFVYQLDKLSKKRKAIRKKFAKK